MKIKTLLWVCVFFQISCFSNHSETVLASYVPKTDIPRADILTTAKSQLGMKYKNNSNVPPGFDCSGFVQYVFLQNGRTISRSTKYQAMEGITIPIKNAKPADLLFFERNNRIFHVAIVVTNNEEGLVVIHSTSSYGVRLDNITKSKYWKPKIKFARDVISR